MVVRNCSRHLARIQTGLSIWSGGHSVPALLHVLWNVITFRYMGRTIRRLANRSDADSWAFNWNLTRKFYHSVIRVTLLVERTPAHEDRAHALAPHAQCFQMSCQPLVVLHSNEVRTKCIELFVQADKHGPAVADKVYAVKTPVVHSLAFAAHSCPLLRVIVRTIAKLPEHCILPSIRSRWSGRYVILLALACQVLLVICAAMPG